MTKKTFRWLAAKQDMTKLLGGKRKLSSLTILKQRLPNLTGHNLEQDMQPLMKKFEITVSLP